MRILVAADHNPYTQYAVRETAKLAINTWADVTLLGVYPRGSRRSAQAVDLLKEWQLNPPLSRALQHYRTIFLNYCQDEDLPYRQQVTGFELVEIGRGVWEELLVCRSIKKELKVRVRQGSPAREILAESQSEGSDLIVLGCPQGQPCAWEGASDVPRKVLTDGGCSVLLVKEQRPMQTILCCLDQTNVSQESLEMINQLATINQAKLQLVGLAVEGGIKIEVDKHLAAIQEYYDNRGIDTWVRLIEASSLADYIAREAGQDLLAFWMGKKSILDRMLGRDWVGKLATTSRSSVLVLR